MNLDAVAGLAREAFDAAYGQEPEIRDSAAGGVTARLLSAQHKLAGDLTDDAAQAMATAAGEALAVEAKREGLTAFVAPSGSAPKHFQAGASRHVRVMRRGDLVVFTVHGWAA